MSVSKEVNGTWTVQCYYTDMQGARKHKKRRGFKTRREAREWERLFLGEGSPKDMVLEEFVPVYFEDHIFFRISGGRGCLRLHRLISYAGRTT